MHQHASDIIRDHYVTLSNSLLLEGEETLTE